VLAVVPVGAGRVVRVAVHRDFDEVAGDRLGAGVVEGAADPAAVRAVGVGQLGELLLDDQPGARRQPLHRHRRVAVQRRAAGVAQLVVLLEALPDQPAGAEDSLGTAGEVLGGLVPPPFDMADVRGVEPHPRGELLLAHSALDPPVRQSRYKLVSGPLDGRGGHHRCPLRDENSSVTTARCPLGASSE
jgi:hypothetical protein